MVVGPKEGGGEDELGGGEDELEATALVRHLTFTKDSKIFTSVPVKCWECYILGKSRKNHLANQ